MTSAHSDHSVELAGSSARAGFFGPADRPRFGWMHLPSQPGLDTAIVIVPPFGYEAVCAQRALRHLAEDAAKAGLLAVRFDLDGTGDSAGDDLDPDRLGHWLDSIDDACAIARDAGARRIVLAGVRMGAILALLAAVRCGEVAGVVAIATVTSGKALLREGRALQMAIGLAPSPTPVVDDGAQEQVGFVLTAETRAALGSIDLLQLAAAPAPAVLLLDRDDMPPNAALATHLAALGVGVKTARLGGYVGMVLDPHQTEVPHAIIDATIAFATSLAQPSLAPAPTAACGLRVQTQLPEAASTIREEAVGLDEALFAIATHPPMPPRRAVILLNAGAVGRIGPNRLHVALARGIASRGDLVMRIDLSGLGDSRARADAEENIVYHDHAVADVGVAVAWARRTGVREVALVGLCAGAYHSLRAALAGVDVETIVIINPLTFHYVPGAPLDAAAFRITEDALRYHKSMTSGASWRKLVRGEVNLLRVAAVLQARARTALARPLRDAMRRLGKPLRDDLGSELVQLAERGVAVRFIFAADDPGATMLAEEGGSVLPRLIKSGRIAIRSIAGPDHTFTPRWSHALLLAAIAEAIGL